MNKRVGVGTGQVGWVWTDFFYPTQLSWVCKTPTHWPFIKVVGLGGSVDRFWRAAMVGFRGFLPLQQQTNRKSFQQQTSTNHRNKKLIVTSTTKKSTKHNNNNNKSANQQIHQYWTKPMKVKVVPRQKQQDLAKIWRDLTRYGEI